MVIVFIKRIIVNVVTLTLFFSLLVSFISNDCHMLSQDKPKNEKELFQS